MAVHDDFGGTAIMPPCTQQAQTTACDVGEIVRSLRQDIDTSDLRILIVYFFPRPDADELAQALSRAFAPGPVVGCSTGGEIGPLGYTRNTVVAVGLSSPDFSVSCRLIDHLSERGSEETLSTLQNLLDQAEPQVQGSGRYFAVTLFDGFCLREEHVSSAIHAVLGDIPVCGGSASDGRQFSSSPILYDGRLHHDCVLVMLVHTNRAFHVFKTEHFLPLEQRLVVTGADVDQRIVTEINGRPAAQEYARLIGCPREKLDLVQFARHPLIVRVGSTNFVRSIIQCQDDDSLTFACAIDVGLVLRLGEGFDMTSSLAQKFGELRERIGEPALVLGFDCILRRFEMEDKGETDKVAAVMKANRVAGFSTQGEHFQGMHINQTFTGIALGRRSGMA